MNLRTFLLAVLAACVAATATAVRADYSFSDDFNGPALNANLVDIDGRYFFSGGRIGTTSPRSYIRTVESDYLSINFQADLIYSMGGSSSGATGVFFGIGAATKDAGFFDEPEAAIYLVDHPNGFATVYRNSEIVVRVNRPGPALTTDLNSFPLPDGLSYVRMTKIGDSLTFEYDHTYNGISFQPDGSFTLSISAAAPFLASKSHILFGTGSSPSRFDRIQVTQLPAAAAGPDQTVNEGAVVTLDGSASTGQNPTFDWQQVAGPSVQLSDPAIANPSFTAPELPGGFGSQVLTFRLTVTTGMQTSSDSVDVTVRNVNRAPVAEAGADQTIREGNLATLDGSASFDPDSDPLVYQWSQTGGPAVELTGADTARPSFTAPLLPGGASGSETLAFGLTVSDGALSSADTVQVVVQQLNQAPVANAGPDQTRNEGTVVTLNGAGSGDPDGDPVVAFAWTQVSGSPVALSNPGSSTPFFTAPLTGPGGATLLFELSVSDGFLGSTVPDQVAINVVNVNDPPRCSAAQPSPARLWPPNHKMVQVGIVGVADPNNDQVRIAITGVAQDEPTSGLSDGDSSPDAVIQGDKVLLRAERSGNGNGRIYQISFTASDIQPGGGSCAGSVIVGVPHDGKLGSSAVDDGQRYNSTSP